MRQRLRCRRAGRGVAQPFVGRTGRGAVPLRPATPLRLGVESRCPSPRSRAGERRRGSLLRGHAAASARPNSPQPEPAARANRGLVHIQPHRHKHRYSFHHGWRPSSLVRPSRAREPTKSAASQSFPHLFRTTVDPDAPSCLALRLLGTRRIFRCPTSGVMITDIAMRRAHPDPDDPLLHGANSR
jgi:hypothetical protein